MSFIFLRHSKRRKENLSMEKSLNRKLNIIQMHEEDKLKN